MSKKYVNLEVDTAAIGRLLRDTEGKVSQGIIDETVRAFANARAEATRAAELAAFVDAL